MIAILFSQKKRKYIHDPSLFNIIRLPKAEEILFDAINLFFHMISLVYESRYTNSLHCTNFANANFTNTNFQKTVTQMKKSA